MKHDPCGLDKILAGTIVAPIGEDHMFLTADISDLSQYIYIPIGAPKKGVTYLEKKVLSVPGEDDIPIRKKCLIVPHLNAFDENDFVWIEKAGCWAYCHKP